jgi:hypothetical protein
MYLLIHLLIFQHFMSTSSVSGTAPGTSEQKQAKHLQPCTTFILVGEMQNKLDK